MTVANIGTTSLCPVGIGSFVLVGGGTRAVSTGGLLAGTFTGFGTGGGGVRLVEFPIFLCVCVSYNCVCVLTHSIPRYLPSSLCVSPHTLFACTHTHTHTHTQLTLS